MLTPMPPWTPSPTDRPVRDIVAQGFTGISTHPNPAEFTAVAPSTASTPVTPSKPPRAAGSAPPPRTPSKPRRAPAPPLTPPLRAPAEFRRDDHTRAGGATCARRAQKKKRPRDRQQWPPVPPKQRECPAGSERAEHILRRAKFSVDFDAIGTLLGGEKTARIKRITDGLQDLDVDSLLRDGCDVIELLDRAPLGSVCPKPASEAVDVSAPPRRPERQKPVASKISRQHHALEAFEECNHAKLNKTTLVVAPPPTAADEFEVVCIFVSGTADQHEAWGRGDDESDPPTRASPFHPDPVDLTGAHRAHRLMDGMAARQNALEHNTLSGHMYAIGNRLQRTHGKVRFNHGTYQQEDKGLGEYQPKPNAPSSDSTFRADRKYVAEAVSRTERLVSPRMGRLRLELRKALGYEGAVPASGDAVSGTSFVGSRGYGCPVHRDGSDYCMEAIQWIQQSRVDREKKVPWHFSVAPAGVLFDLAAAAPCFILLNAARVAHGTLPSTERDEGGGHRLVEHGGVGFANVTDGDLLRDVAKRRRCE